MFVYADNAATTAMSKAAIDAMTPAMHQLYGNPSSLHQKGREANYALMDARETVARCLNAQPREIYFTGCGTESDNWAITEGARLGAEQGKKHIISDPIEHHAVLHTLAKLEKQGFEVTYLPVHEDGVVRLEELAASDRAIPGLSTGLRDLDRAISGLNKSDLVLLAARPGMGKTSMALNILLDAGKRSGKNVAFFSLEMSRDQLGMRLLCAGAQVDSQNARTGALSEKDFYSLADAMVPLEGAPIYIDDTAIIGPTEMMAKLRRLRQQVGDIGLVVIDYLQLMDTGRRSENRQQEISQITRSLKVAAKELQVPIMLLSQLSRATEKRENKRPMLSDLRESGAIEQDADVVLFLHREDYYSDDEQHKGDASIIIAKQRSGPTGTINVMWKGEQTKYLEVDFREDE